METEHRAALSRELTFELRQSFAANGWFTSDIAQASCHTQLGECGAIEPDGHDPWVFCAQIGETPGRVLSVASDREGPLLAAGWRSRLRLRRSVDGFVIGTASRLLLVTPRTSAPWTQSISLVTEYAQDGGKLLSRQYPTFELRIGSETLKIAWRVPNSHTAETSFALLSYGILLFGLGATGSDIYDDSLKRFSRRRREPKKQIFTALARYSEACMALADPNLARSRSHSM